MKVAFGFARMVPSALTMPKQKERRFLYIEIKS